MDYEAILKKTKEYLRIYFGDEIVDAWVKAHEEPTFDNLGHLERCMNQYCFSLAKDNGLEALLESALDTSIPELCQKCLVYAAWLKISEKAPRVVVTPMSMSDGVFLKIQFVTGGDYEGSHSCGGDRI